MGKDKKIINKKQYSGLLKNIGQLIYQSRELVVHNINVIQTYLYWLIGREIVEFEQNGHSRAEYGKQVLLTLSKDLTTKFQRGFSVDNLELMRKFYLIYSNKYIISETPSRKSQKSETLSRKLGEIQPIESIFNNTIRSLLTKEQLSWSHYCELCRIENEMNRTFYEQEAITNNWSVRELKRQINSMLFERITKSKDVKKVMELAKKGQDITKPEDIIKDPYILEFLNLKEETVYTEKQLETAIIDKLQEFLLELGKGFTFVARQKRIPISNKHYKIDLVFYNRILKCLFLIDLKIGELDHADIGQMNFYLNYCKEHEMYPDEKEPIGLVLCAKKDDIFAKYVLGNINNRIFTSQYKLALPSEKEIKEKLKQITLMREN